MLVRAVAVSRRRVAAPGQWRIGSMNDDMIIRDRIAGKSTRPIA
jgi:hypothetical protein